MVALLNDAIRECQFETLNVVPRPFEVWPIVEGIAWFINDNSFDFSVATDGEERAQMITMIGTLFLTVLEHLVSQELFTTGETRVIHNLSLILALMLRFGNAVDKEEYCLSNENGGACKVLCLAETHHVEFYKIDGIDDIIQSVRDKGNGLDAKRARERSNRWLKEQWGVMRMATDKELGEYAANEGEPPAKRGTGKRKQWLPEDDYDVEGLRYWKRWQLQYEYMEYL